MSEESVGNTAEGCSDNQPMGEDTLTGATGRFEFPGNYDEFLDKLLHMAEERGWAKTFLAGEWVFHAGEVPEECWLIGVGRVSQYRGDARINELGKRRFLGMRAFHLQVPHTTSAQALEPSVLIKIGGEFYQKLLSHPEFVDVAIKQYEQEVQRVGDEVMRYRAQLEAARRDNAILQRAVGEYEKEADDAPRDKKASVTERLLRLLRPDLEEADRRVGAMLAGLPEETQRTLRNNGDFGQLNAIITRCWNRVRPLTFLRK
ncbi:MAG: cyclic nucleotide-binding domain-containing protein [Patescibacteria group bacterium]